MSRILGACQRERCGSSSFAARFWWAYTVLRLRPSTSHARSTASLSGRCPMALFTYSLNCVNDRASTKPFFANPNCRWQSPICGSIRYSLSQEASRLDQLEGVIWKPQRYEYTQEVTPHDRLEGVIWKLWCYGYSRGQP